MSIHHWFYFLGGEIRYLEKMFISKYMILLFLKFHKINTNYSTFVVVNIIEVLYRGRLIYANILQIAEKKQRSKRYKAITIPFGGDNLYFVQTTRVCLI